MRGYFLCPICRSIAHTHKSDRSVSDTNSLSLSLSRARAHAHSPFSSLSLSLSSSVSVGVPFAFSPSCVLPHFLSLSPALDCTLFSFFWCAPSVRILSLPFIRTFSHTLLHSVSFSQRACAYVCVYVVSMLCLCLCYVHVYVYVCVYRCGRQGPAWNEVWAALRLFRGAQGRNRLPCADGRVRNCWWRCRYCSPGPRSLCVYVCACVRPSVRPCVRLCVLACAWACVGICVCVGCGWYRRAMWRERKGTWLMQMWHGPHCAMTTRVSAYRTPSLTCVSWLSIRWGRLPCVSQGGRDSQGRVCAVPRRRRRPLHCRSHRLFWGAC